MSRNTKIALGIGALAIVGYVFFKRRQMSREPTNVRADILDGKPIIGGNPLGERTH